MNLGDLQTRLSKHFHTLHKERSSEPIFALEHGLGPSEVDELSAEVRRAVEVRPPSESHWLPWVIYASELGYNYVGYEYWYTFETRTRGWLRWGIDRAWLRRQFSRFEHAYGGAVPSGPWAEHFTIICHPITHAILPKDFQSQLSQVLNDIGRWYTNDILQSSRALGELIRDSSGRQSKRFQQFVEDVEIVGLIAKALLSEHQAESNGILLSQTLQRIVNDLSREEAARQHLSNARMAAQSVRRRGFASSHGRPQGTQAARRRLGDNDDVVLRLLLRPLESHKWGVYLEVPDFTPLAVCYANFKHLLEQRSCRIAGARKPLARSALLYGSSIVPLSQFPQRGIPLLSFGEDLSAEETSELRTVLQDHISFEQGPSILCRIAKDGRAYQMRQLLVRPGRQYIYLNTEHPPQANNLLRPIETTCSGIHAAILTIPQSISADTRVLLEKLGLEVIGEVNLFPAGITPAAWDDEGAGEWLHGEPILLGFNSEFDFHSLRLEIEQEGSPLPIQPVAAGKTYYFELPKLPLGSHRLTLSARERAGQEEVIIGKLDIKIREARDWQSALHQHGALIFIIDPRVPTLEDLIQGRVSLEIIGPADHTVQVHIEILGRNANQPTPVSGSVKWQLPVDPNSGRKYLMEQLNRRDVQFALDSATACRIHFSAAELGDFVLTCEREFTPLRWYAERQPDAYLLTLSDDTGACQQTAISHFGFEQPDVGNAINYGRRLEGYRAPDKGGLFVAICGTDERGIILPPSMGATTLRTFADLGQTFVTPRFRHRPPTLESVKELLALDERWAGALVTNSVYAMLARQRVRLAIVAEIFSILGGAKWAQAERNYENAPQLPNAAAQLCAALGIAPDVQSDLIMLIDHNWENSSDELAAALADILNRSIRNITLPRPTGPLRTRGSRWQVKLALRMASAPDTVKAWAKEYFDPGLNELMRNQVLPRAARFAVLVTTYHRQQVNPENRRALYPGWEWL